jgi:uncharacterized protein (DUF4415 family)
MLLKTKSGRLVELPTDEEAAEINAGIAADPDTFEWTDEDFKRAVPFSALPEDLQAVLRGRGKQKAATKISTTVRFDTDVLAAFKATGRGWQTRMNDALKEWLKEHSSA